MSRPSPQEAMRGFLSGEDPGLTRARRIFRHLPGPPRCKLCVAPFEGPGGALLRHVGFSRFPGNPAICSFCIKSLNKIGIYGAEIAVSLFFADIRGSTGIAERMNPTEFRTFLDRFYRMATEAILGNDGIVDKFVGDEAIGLFFVGISGPSHSAAAIRAARTLLRMAGADDATPSGRIPVGAAVHTGDAYVGTSATDGVVNDFTALGDVVNTTARLASQANAGELLVSIAAAEAAGLDVRAGPSRRVDVRGRSEPISVLSLPTDERTD